MTNIMKQSNILIKIGMILTLAFVLFAGFGITDNTVHADWEKPASLTDPTAQDATKDSPITKLGSWVAGQLMYIYALIVAVVSIMFIVKHQYSKLAAFFIIAIIVAIPIFAPDAIPTIAESIADALKG